MIAMPVVGTVLAAIWLVLHSATSLMLETFSPLANANDLAASWDETAGLYPLYPGYPHYGIPLFTYLSIRLDQNFMA